MARKKLIIVCGLSGTGKTTVARLITEKFHAVHLRTDAIRKEIFPKPTYSPEESEFVYQEFFRRAERAIKTENVVMDATFMLERGRVAARKIAELVRADFFIIETYCPENIVKERIEARKNDESDAQFIHCLDQKKKFEPITEKHIIIDTSQDINEQLKNYPFNE